MSRDAASSTTTTASAVARQPRERPGSRPSSQPTAKRASAHVASSRPVRSLLPPFGELGSSQSTGSGTLGGRVPSAPVLAVAALIAFFLLAAPSLGRRIRLARELSPRSTYRSSSITLDESCLSKSGAVATTARRHTDSTKGDKMKRVFLALAVALLLLLAGVGTATASPPASQGSGQWAGSEQGCRGRCRDSAEGSIERNSPG